MNITVKIESEVKLPDHICISALEAFVSHIERLVEEEAKKDDGSLVSSLREMPVYTRSCGMVGRRFGHLKTLRPACEKQPESVDNPPQGDNYLYLHRTRS